MPKIILVDDDVTNIALIKMLLELDGFSVAACTDIAQAHQAATNNHISAFIIDHNLARGANGLQLLHDIRAGNTAAAPSTVVIMTSGDDRQAEAAQRAGASEFLLKPYSPTLLTITLQTHLGQIQLGSLASGQGKTHG